MRNGSEFSIPEDSFVFVANLCFHVLVSKKDTLSALWCFSTNDTCFAATLTDSDTLMDAYGPCVRGQWKVGLASEGAHRVCRMQFLRQSDNEEVLGPLWLRDRIAPIVQSVGTRVRV